MKTINSSICYFINGLILTYAMIFSTVIIAAAPVENIKNNSNKNNHITNKSMSQSLNIDAHYQTQLLKQEVRSLRGIVEELKNEVDLISKQQKDNYQNLDQRLSSQSRYANNSSKIDNSKIIETTTSIIDDKNKLPLPLSNEEKQYYDNTYANLKSGNIDKAISGFKSHNIKYPNGTYAANAHYWLGEIYLLQSQLSLAHESFLTVHQDYPKHLKYLDATFKLGQVYFMQGDKVKAKKIINSIADGDTNTAILARNFIAENF